MVFSSGDLKTFYKGGKFLDGENEGEKTNGMSKIIQYVNTAVVLVVNIF